MYSLFAGNEHANHVFRDMGSDLMVQANQHLVIDHGEAMLLDPGGHKVYAQIFGAIANLVPLKDLKHVFFSHQDPDIVAAANGWLMVTDAQAHISGIWTRFITHFGVDRLVADRVLPIPDGGTKLKLGQTELLVIPAHFLHSAANFQVYDPISKILYTGDLGASLTVETTEAGDMDAHIEAMRPFHERIMGGSRMTSAWAAMARQLDIEIIAPQHGAAIRGRESVTRFIDWIDGLACGPDLVEGFALPQ